MDADPGPEPPRPNYEQFGDALTEIDAELEGLKALLREVYSQLNAVVNQEALLVRSASLRRSMDEVTQQIEELEEQKDNCMKMLNERWRERQLALKHLLDHRLSLGFTDDREVDLRLEALEQEIEESRLSLAEQKTLLTEIAKLCRYRSEAEHFHRIHGESATAADPAQHIQDEIGPINEEIHEARALKGQLVQQYRDLQQERQRRLTSLPETMRERDSASARMALLLEERAKMEEQFKAHERAHELWYTRTVRKKEREERLRIWEEEQRFLEEEALRFRAERQARIDRIQGIRTAPREELLKFEPLARLSQVPTSTLDRHVAGTADPVADRIVTSMSQGVEAKDSGAPALQRFPNLKEEDVPFDQPHVVEIRLLETALRFCKTRVPQEPMKDIKEPKTVENPFPGTVQARPRSQTSQDFYIPPSKLKKRSSSKATRGCQGALITHFLQTLPGGNKYHDDVPSCWIFQELGLDPPTSTHQLSSVVERLEQQLERRRKEVVEWEQKREQLRRMRLERDLDKARAAQEAQARKEEGWRSEALSWVRVVLSALQDGRRAVPGCDDPVNVVTLRGALSNARKYGVDPAELVDAQTFLIGRGASSVNV